MLYEPNVKVKGPVKLDLKDKKIMKYLEYNSRQSYSSIAKNVGLSKESVRYRIKQLEDKGVIQEYKVVIDIKKLDYLICHIFITLNNPEFEVEEQYLQNLYKFPFVRAIIKFNGDFDYEIAIIGKNIDELDENITKLLGKVSKFVKRQEVMLITKTYIVRNLPKSFIDFKIESKESLKTKGKDNNLIKLDSKDMKILNEIKDQANEPVYKISQNTSLTSDIITYRMKKMKEQGFIISYTTAFNYKALSYQMYAILLNMNSLDKNLDSKLKAFLKEDGNVVWGVKTIGEYNVVIYVCTEKPSDLHLTLNKIRSTFRENINEYKTLIAYEKLKYTYIPDRLSF